MRFLMSFISVVLFTVSAAQAQRSIEFVNTAGASGAAFFAIADETDLSMIESVAGAEVSARIAQAIAATGFIADVGTMAHFVGGDEAWGEVHLVAVHDEMTARDWQDFGGRVAGVANTLTAEDIFIVGGVDAQNTAIGAVLGGYTFNKYKSEHTPVTGRIAIVTDDAAAAAAEYAARSGALAQAVSWARDQQSEPANALYPEEFVRRARAALRGVDNVSIKVLDVRAMERMGMGAILGVGRGSVRPPRMLIIHYRGADGDPLILAGKGITFDTGGISLKPNQNMWQMKSDMTGAAVVTATAMSLAKSKAPVNVVAIAALAENMPDGRAQRPGDVVRTMSGKTVEILSTDAEGRLVLADAVWYAQETYSPEMLIDVATLTGSVGRALGDEYAGLFSHDDEIADALIAVGERSGDDLWRLPLHKNHFVQIKSKIGDIKNSNTGAPGASTGAAFIGSFIKEETPWAHLDIAGVDWPLEPTPTTPVGASGFGVRLLDAYAREMAGE